MVMTVATRMALAGERCLALMMARNEGNALIRPIANAVLLETFTPAFALAMVEFTIARKTSIQNKPYKDLAMPSQEAGPAPLNLKKEAGPNATSTAYVVKTYSRPIESMASRMASRI